MTSLNHRVTLARFLRILSATPVVAALAATPATTITIPDSTPVKLFLIDRISSATGEVDDPIRFGVAEDVRIGSVVVIPQGSVARGHLVEVQHRKRVGQAGKLEFALEYVKAPDGTVIRLRTSAARQSKRKSSKRLSPLLLMSRGKETGMAQGAHVLAFVDGPIEVGVGNLPVSPAAAATSQPATTSQPAAQ